MCPASAPTISNPFSAALMCPVMGKRQGLLQAAAGHGHGYTEAGQGGPSHLLHMRRVAWVRSTLEANSAHIYLFHSCPPSWGQLLARDTSPGRVMGVSRAKPSAAAPGIWWCLMLNPQVGTCPYAGDLLAVHVSVCFQVMSSPVPGSHWCLGSHPGYREDRLGLSSSKASNNKILS